MRVTTAVAVLAILVVVSAHGGTITSLSPSTFRQTPGEDFLTINGSALGARVRYAGPAGTFTLDANFRNAAATQVVAWVPGPVLSTAGSYTVTVLDANGTPSNGMTLTITGGLPNKFHIHIQAALALEALTREGTGLKYDVTWTGTQEIPSISCDPPSGSTFKIGVTDVRCTGRLATGESASATERVLVFDGPPTLKLPDLIRLESKEPMTVDYRVSATDRIDGSLEVNCSPKSGSFFPFGTTQVSCWAMDSAQNVSAATFPIEIVDLGGRLRINVPSPITAEADNAEGAYVDFVVTAEGSEDPNPDIKCDPVSGSLFPLGATTNVFCRASDKFGQTADGEFHVDVVDTAGPVISTIRATPNWIEPTGEMELTTLEIDVVDVTDPKPLCSITDVTANEPITEDDWKVASETEVYLRAVTGEKFDRVYSVNVKCADRNENVSTGGVNVTISREKPPQDLSKNPQPTPKIQPAPTKKRAAGRG